jgi:hypothetical protein
MDEQNNVKRSGMGKSRFDLICVSENLFRKRLGRPKRTRRSEKAKRSLGESKRLDPTVRFRLFQGSPRSFWFWMGKTRFNLICVSENLCQNRERKRTQRLGHATFWV